MTDDADWLDSIPTWVKVALFAAFAIYVPPAASDWLARLWNDDADGRPSVEVVDTPTAPIGWLINCSDVEGPVLVGADDPYGLDADNDGIGCE